MATKIASNQIVPGGSILEETSVNHSKACNKKIKKKSYNIWPETTKAKLDPSLENELQIMF